MTAGLAPPPAASVKPRWVPAYVALGSNLGEPANQVERAIEALAALPGTRLMLRSASYRSRPMGPVEQPDFVNAVAALLTQLDPGTMLRELQALETRLGREVPVVRWGPRLIDLDLLVHGQARCNESALILPHPGIAERAFVLVPLAEICPTLDVPDVGRVAALLQRLDPSALERIPGTHCA